MYNVTFSGTNPKPSFPTKTTLKSLINFDTIVHYVDWQTVDLNSKVLPLNVLISNSLKDLIIVKLNIGFDEDVSLEIGGGGAAAASSNNTNNTNIINNNNYNNNHSFKKSQSYKNYQHPQLKSSP
ncbi:unnamed protein product [Ambrosiozyma monospora]|uniref:Unnamed protein product n=1 Tax=Ambrosiozyma monospora TaxID=43982 RepID=A0A9W6T9V9_AMBMO|nr:unnamed protein product [Ambrosiozyma monospora]